MRTATAGTTLDDHAATVAGTLHSVTKALREVRSHLPAVAIYNAGGAAFYGLKAFCSGANADDLRPVLAPTCWLAARLGGMIFTDEGAAGFISHADHLVVGTACSGANFLVVCFGALFFSFAHRLREARARVAWLVASLALAWAATVLTNAVRVVLAARLYQLDIHGALLTPARLHRLLGVILYCTSLVLIHGAVSRWFLAGTPREPARPRTRLARVVGSPFTWYLGVAVLMPLLRRAPHGFDARLAEHVAVVVAVVLLAAGLRAIAKRVGDRLQSKPWRGASAP